LGDDSDPGHSIELDSWAKSLKWWTRTQRIRTLSEVPFEAAILDTDAASIYQQIASKAAQFQQLGMSNLAIARRLGVTDKSVGKAISWLRRVQLRPDN
jgi:hypothetical protein